MVNTVIGRRIFSAALDPNDALGLQYYHCETSQRTYALVASGLAMDTESSVEAMKGAVVLLSVCTTVLFVHKEGVVNFDLGLLRGIHLALSMKKRLAPVLEMVESGVDVVRSTPLLGFVFFGENATERGGSIEQQIRMILNSARLRAAEPLFCLDPKRCAFMIDTPLTKGSTVLDQFFVRTSNSVKQSASLQAWQNSVEAVVNLVAGFEGANYDNVVTLRMQLQPLQRLAFLRSAHGREVALQTVQEMVADAEEMLLEVDVSYRREDFRCPRSVTEVLREAALLTTPEWHATLQEVFLETLCSYAVVEMKEAGLQAVKAIWEAHCATVQAWQVNVAIKEVVTVSTCGTALVTVVIAKRDNPLHCLAYQDSPHVLLPLVPLNGQPMASPTTSVCVLTIPPPDPAAFLQLPLDSEMLAYLNDTLVQPGDGGGVASHLQRVVSAGRDVFTAGGGGDGAGGTFFVVLEYCCRHTGQRWTLDPANPCVLTPGGIRAPGLPHCDVPLFMTSPGGGGGGAGPVSTLQSIYIVTDAECVLTFNPRFGFFKQSDEAGAGVAGVASLCHREAADEVCLYTTRFDEILSTLM